MAFSNRPTTVADYLAILRRRKWIVLVPPVVAAAAALPFRRPNRLYTEPTAQVLVNPPSVVTAITQVDPSGDDPVRFLQTQASIARAPELAARVAAASGIPGMTAGRVLSESQVTPSADSDLIGISVGDGDPAAAVRLANTYATQFTQFSKERATNYIDEALASLQTRIKSLAARPKGKSTRLSTRRSFSSKVSSQLSGS